MRGKRVVIDARWLNAMWFQAILQPTSSWTGGLDDAIEHILEYPPNRLVYLIFKGFVIVIVALLLTGFLGLFFIPTVFEIAVLALGPYAAPFLPLWAQYLMGIGIGMFLVAGSVRIAQWFCK